MTEDKPASESSATQLLNEGRRHFICREFSQSVEKLSEACELLVKEYGEGNVALADAFYSYGEALLEMARMETPVLGNALKDVPDVIDEADTKEGGDTKEADEPDDSLNDEMKEEIADKVIDALCSAPVIGDESEKTPKKSAEESDKDKEAKADDNDKKEKDETDNSEVEKASESAEMSEKPTSDKADSAEKTTEEQVDDKITKETPETDDQDKNEDEGEEEEEDEGEEVEEEGEGEGEGEEDGEAVASGDEAATGNDENDVGNLQLAWEVIEVARTLYEKKASSEEEASKNSQLRVADCHRKLGEVMMERDEWEPAAEELRKCRVLEEKYSELPNRRIAETYFQIGVAFDNAEKVSEASEAFEKSAECLEEFQKVLSKKEDKSKEDEEEIKEIDALTQEIRTRVTEMKAQKTTANALQTDGAGSSGSTSSGQAAFGVTTNGFGSDSKSNGVSHPKENGDVPMETKDISHLIRKRPKDVDSAGSPVKKIRVESKEESVENKEAELSSSPEKKASAVA